MHWFLSFDIKELTLKLKRQRVRFPEHARKVKPFSSSIPVGTFVND